MTEFIIENVLRPLGLMATDSAPPAKSPARTDPSRMHLTIGLRLVLWSAVIVLLVAGLSVVSLRTSGGLLDVNAEVSRSLDQAAATEKQARRLAAWGAEIEQTRSLMTGVLHALIADMVGNHDRLEPFAAGANDPLGDFLQSEAATGIAETFPQAATSLQNLQAAHGRLLEASRQIGGSWQPRHAGLAEGLNDLKTSLNYWNLKVANTIFIHSSMLELLADDLNETAVEEFHRSALYQDAAPRFPLLVERLDSAVATNRQLYEASRQLAGLMLRGEWEEVRTFYRDSFPFMLKSILVDIDHVLAVEQQSIVAQERAMAILDGAMEDASQAILREFHSLQQILQERIERQQQEVQTAAAEVRRSRAGMEQALARMRFANQVAPALVIAITLIGGLIISRSVTRPLRNTVVRLQEIAEGAGDLTRELPVRSGDEVGQLAASFNRFMGRQRDMIGNLRQVATDLVGAANQIRDVAGKVNSGALQQTQALEATTFDLQATLEDVQGIGCSTGTLVAASEECTAAALELGATIQEISEQMEQLFNAVEQVSSATTEMSASSRQIEGSLGNLGELTRRTSGAVRQLDARNVQIEQKARLTDELAEQATQHARGGLESVQSALRGVTDLSETISSTGTVIQELGRQSQAIGQILTVIDDVADQTGLLALNATIIAAQAGEGGRAFAVVADEIRGLASRTALSTREIAGIIHTLQTTVDEAVTAMSAGESKAHQEVDRSRHAAEALERIQQSTVAARTEMAAILESVHAQVEESRAISGHTDEVSRMLEQVAAAVAQLSSGIRQNAGLSEHIRGIAGSVNSSTQEQAAGSRNIARSIETIRSMITEIDAATHDQSQRTEKTVISVRQIKQISEVTVEQTVEMENVVQLLGRHTGTLRQDMGSFRI
ncbi:MAG: methyl-accepting chemotaxis protein [Desulfuromonadales bacterium]|nr:methyl-accepting chemotaxis protein [Desulfuromonadales bacterium]